MRHRHLAAQQGATQGATELINPQNAMSRSGIGDRYNRRDHVGYGFAGTDGGACLLQLCDALRHPPRFRRCIRVIRRV